MRTRRGCQYRPRKGGARNLSLYCSTFCLFPFTVSALDRDTGYNMGSVCVLWFIWLLTLIQTIGDIEASMLLENSKSIFSFLQPLFPSVSDSAGHKQKTVG